MNQVNTKSMWMWGVGGIILGVALCVLAWDVQQKKYAGLPGLAGVISFVAGLGLVVFPFDKLLKPNAIIDGKPVYDNDNPKYTPLGIGMFATGLIGGLAYAAFLFITNRA